jgi:PleD family two-component response regulator
MTHDGVRKALEGHTTIDEIFRVAPPEVGQISEMLVAEPILKGRVEKTALKFADRQYSASAVRPKKILVVDDDDVFIRLVATILEAENYQVISASDGDEGLKLAIEEKPDLIITDLQMPEMDGITLVKKLKSQLSTRIIPTIMLTVKDDLGSEVEGLEAGADDYLTKPIETERFIARVNRFLNSDSRATAAN